MALIGTLLESRWLRVLYCSHEVELTLQTAVHVVRPCIYTVTTVDALRSTTPTLSVLSGHSVLFTPHLDPQLLIFRMFASGPRGGITNGLLTPLGFQPIINSATSHSLMAGLRR